MVLCLCGRLATVRTSWTNNNPGRRFWGCPELESTCGFIGWVDGPMCDRSKVVIPGLLRSMNKLENEKATAKGEAKKMKEEAAKMKFYLFCSWIIFVMVLVLVK